MSTIKADYLIVGQGLAGSWLCFELLKRGCSVQIVNEGTTNTSSLKAAGIYNPITGRKMVKTWRADDLFLHLENRYRELEKLTNGDFLHEMPIYRPFKSIEDQNDWDGKQADEFYDPYISSISKESQNIRNILDPFGGIILQKSGYVDLPKFIESSRSYFHHKGIYQEEVFDYQEVKPSPESVTYKGEIFKKIIYCDGVSTNPFWNLPFRPVRGEVLDIRCEFETNMIVNQGVFMIPKGDRVTIGSTYDHSVLSYEPQEAGINSLKERLSKLYTGKFEILDARAGIRPATHDRKPYIGFHKEYKTLGIFNGLGTKGVSLAPYFANHFADVLQGASELDKEVDVQRVF